MAPSMLPNINPLSLSNTPAEALKLADISPCSLVQL